MLTGIGATLLSWLASKGASIILGALFHAATDAWATYQSNQAQRDAGANATAAAVNKETSDAQRRAAQAQIDAPDVAGTIDDMSKGKF